MRKMLRTIEIGFWTVFAGVIAILARSSGLELPYALLIVASGAGLSMILLCLREREKTKNSIGLVVAVLWFIFYFGVGYPNTLRPPGDRPASTVLLLVLIAGLPLLVLLPTILLKKRTT